MEEEKMGITEGVTFGSGLSPVEFATLIYGQTLLFKRGGENSIVAEVTVEEILFDEVECRIKVRKIVKQGMGSKIVVGDKLTATVAELTKV